MNYLYTLVLALALTGQCHASNFLWSWMINPDKHAEVYMFDLPSEVNEQSASEEKWLDIAVLNARHNQVPHWVSRAEQDDGAIAMTVFFIAQEARPFQLVAGRLNEGDTLYPGNQATLVKNMVGNPQGYEIRVARTELAERMPYKAPVKAKQPKNSKVGPWQQASGALAKSPPSFKWLYAVCLAVGWLVAIVVLVRKVRGKRADEHLEV